MPVSPSFGPRSCLPGTWAAMGRLRTLRVLLTHALKHVKAQTHCFPRKSGLDSATKLLEVLGRG